jgi:hypothetical protein
MYKWNTQAHLHDCRCCGIAISITYYKCVPAALVMQHAMGMRCIILPCVSDSTTSFHIISKTA